MNEYRSDIQALMAEIKKCDTEEPGPLEMIHLDSSLVAWVRDTSRGEFKSIGQLVKQGIIHHKINLMR